MAKKGSITISQGKQESDNNRTYITVTGIITTTGESYRGSSRSGVISITQNGKAIHSGTFTHGAPANSTTTLFSVGLWVNHDSEGNSGTIEASYNYDSGWCSASTSKVLTRILRQATITSASDVTDEENPTFTFSNPKGYDLTAELEVNPTNTHLFSKEIENTGSYTFELTDEEREILRGYLANSKSGTLRYLLYSNNRQYVSYVDKKITIVNANPKLEVTAEDVNETAIEYTGNPNVLIKGVSNVLTTATYEALKGAQINAYSVVNGKQTSNITPNIFECVEDDEFEFGVRDSRGIETRKTLKIDMIEYLKPTCELIAHAPDAEGDMLFQVSGKCYVGTFGIKENSIKIYYRYKKGEENYTDWLPIDIDVVMVDNTYEANAFLSGLDYRSRYTFQIMIKDAFSESMSVERVVKTIPTYDWGEEDFNFNVPVNVTGYISINGKKMVDFDAEEGTTGIWSWLKKDSGLVELWGKYWIDNVNCSKEWGAMFESDAIQLPNFPFEFENIPTAQYTWQRGEDKLAAFIEVACPSKTGAGTVHLCRPTNLAVNGYVSMRFVGKMKEEEEL